MSRYHFSLATPADDAQLRGRMACDWIEGAAAISLRREPSFLASSRLLGKPVQIIVGRDTATGRIVATGSRCETASYIDGQPRRTAYLSDLRIDRDHRSGVLLSRVFRYLRMLHDADPLPAYTLIYGDNEAALGNLVGGRAGLPFYLQRARLLARAIRLTRRRARPALPGIELRRAREDELPELVRFINERRSELRWAPILDTADFSPGRRCDTLRAQDFFVALREGRICATIAAWDQAPLRQAHVERYPRATQLLRTPYNLAACLCRLPRLPAIGAPLPYVYLAFIAAENDDAALCAALLRHVYNTLCHGPWLYALAAMHDDDPLLPVLAEYAGTTSVVKMFEVDFSPEADPWANIEPRRVGIEFALS
ncbi:MAG TPA: hypothetical protein VHC91_00530 [Trinickia sp.]|uniref:hypothetical protein n=1 Tax=Trinickia sp. TaxID=2571163 RepID=UPI002CED7ACB|nr:hypothetical protein [Trinickia sp.]HVW48880.1 hypothetical protein [Trinickia sp.]